MPKSEKDPAKIDANLFPGFAERVAGKAKPGPEMPALLWKRSMRPKCLSATWV